jgi:catechol 2,3-dioxygenase-like lactoylglutathione lyase family enzyme
MIVERVDFISVPVTDMDRAIEWYSRTLGLKQVNEDTGQGFPEFQLGENVSIYLLKMENIGSTFTAPHTASIALRVPDVEEARQELMQKGVEFHNGETFDTGVCHMAHFTDPDGNVFMLHRRYAPQD